MIKKLINRIKSLENYKEELIKFFIGIIFLIIIHYQMILQQQDKIFSISNNIEKIKESIDVLSKLNISEISNKKNDKNNTNIKYSINKISLTNPKLLNIFIDDLLNLYFFNSKQLLNFTYFIKSKSKGLIEINYESNFKDSKKFIEKIINYKNLLKLNYVKITDNQTKMEVQVVYDKNNQTI